ncbi:hypothetical protein ACUDCK_11965 [Achromobacter sp. CF-sbj1-Ac2-l]|uniref:hypothetical protein n=1 Tax=Achromobacter TaxID=222 RepID=UPI001583BEBA|nr:hypothetical protein [Achromobacter dolens]
MVAHLKSKTGDLSTNDAADWLQFYKAIPYLDCLVAEKAAISLAKQAGAIRNYVCPVRPLEDLVTLYVS